MVLEISSDNFFHPIINFILVQILTLGEFGLQIFGAYFHYYFFLWNTSEAGQYFFLLCLIFLLISTSLLLVLTESPVHSLIYLMLLLLYLSQLSISFQMHFLGLVFIIIYVGCISVLLLLHINMIVSFISRYTIVKKKKYFFPLILVCIIIPLIQIITLFLSDVYFIKPIYDEIFSFFFLNNINNNLNSLEIPLEWRYVYYTFLDLESSSIIYESKMITFLDKIISVDFNKKNSLFFYYLYFLDLESALRRMYEAKIITITFSDNIISVNTENYFKQDPFFNYTDWVSLVDNTFPLGIVIFTVEFLPLMVGAFILLVSMIGCISITLEKDRNKKKQNIRKQINKNINIKNILTNPLKILYKKRYKLTI